MTKDIVQLGREPAPREVDVAPGVVQTKILVLPDGLYSYEETAEILGLGGTPRSRRNAICRISEQELPRTRTGPNGGNPMVRGRAILQYMDRREGEAA